MTDLLEFLKARIAEDEAAIEARGPFPHSIHSQDQIGEFSPRCPDCLGLPGRARVVAECAAKRTIIEDHTEMVEGIDSLSAALPGNLNQDPDALWRTAPLRALASVYSFHPDFDAAWRRSEP
ncbi:DUF6221 family protein [Paenarthrobacter ilicis]|uniref:DUF6221 family protein n=1 Tax=Paenarthrobacter ilicis TaxID=43665 RepID=UPI0036F2AA59